MCLLIAILNRAELDFKNSELYFIILVGYTFFFVLGVKRLNIVTYLILYNLIF